MSIIVDIILCFFVYAIKKKGSESLQYPREKIGECIRTLRLQKGMSQELLSGLAGIARTHLTMIESGSKQPNLETIWKLAEALQISPHELIRKIEEA